MVLPARAETGPDGMLVRFVYTRADDDARRAVRPSIVQIAREAWGDVGTIQELTAAKVAFTLSVVRS